MIRALTLAAAGTVCLAAVAPVRAQTAKPAGDMVAGAQGPEAGPAGPASPGTPGTPDPRRLLLPTPAEEDWSFLADPTARTDRLDALKYVPIGKGGAYASFGGEARVYLESFRNENFGRPPGGNTYPEFRGILHADLHPSPNLRFYVATQSAFIAGRAGGPRPSVDRDEFDLLEGFAEYHSTEFDQVLKGPAFTLRVGRQQLDFGAGRLLSSREGPVGEGPNVLQGFDGGRAIFRHEAWRLDLFAAKPTETRPGVFNDGWLQGQGVWGAYLAHGRPPGAPGLGEELFYIGTRRPNAPFFGGVANETRHSVGARVFQRGTPFAYDLEAIYQFGTFGSRDISAYGLTAEATYTFEKLPWTPQPGIRVGVNSGGANPDTLKTFYVPFPRGAYFGYLSAIGPENTSGIEGALSLHPTKTLTVTGGAFFFWRQSLDDGIYGLAGFPLLPPTNRERYVGAQPVFSASWRASPHLSLNAAYERFERGDFIKATPGTRSIDYLAAWATFRF